MRRLVLAVALIIVGVAGIVSLAEAAKPGASTLSIPDGVFGGSVTGTFTGDRKVLSDMGGVHVLCYVPGTIDLLLDGYAASVGDDGSVLITPLAGWGTGWESGSADCSGDAGYFTFPHDNKYNPEMREWISVATDTFHVYG